MKRLLIVYHSQSGSTRRLAEAVYQGAGKEPEVQRRLLRAMEAGVDDLLWCDAVIFGTPENLGYMSGGLKDFFDRTFYPAEPHKLNRAYAVFVSAGNDGTGAVRQLERIAKGYPLRCVAEPVIIRGEPGKQGLADCEVLGEAVAAGLIMGIF
jgi:multimeric flavodoxin WrbA